MKISLSHNEVKYSQLKLIRRKIEIIASMMIKTNSVKCRGTKTN